MTKFYMATDQFQLNKSFALKNLHIPQILKIIYKCFHPVVLKRMKANSQCKLKVLKFLITFKFPPFY